MTVPSIAPERREIPETVILSPDSISLRLTPNEMRKVAETTGQNLDALLGEDAEMADRMQTIVWIRLRREGHDLSWDQAGDIVVEFAAVDPTSAASSTSSPPFAGSGG